MKRGEIWTVAGGSGYAGKPRPAVILQADEFSQTASIAICLLTSSLSNTEALRIPVSATAENGLMKNSFVMIDKINTIKRHQVGQLMGQVTFQELVEIDTALMVFLGLAG